MELTRKDTKMIQGLSVMAMVCLHLFCKYDYEGIYQPLLFFEKIALSFYIAQLADFCVMGFAFCSGYAHMILFEESENTHIYYRSRLRSLCVLILNYWIVLIIFSTISIVIGNGQQMPGNISLFLRNLLFDPTYNGAWWYMYAYIIIVVISPILLKMVQKWNVAVLFIGIAVIYTLSYYIRFKMGDAGWIMGKIGPTGMTIAEYLIGAAFFKYKLISKVYCWWKKISKVCRGGWILASYYSNAMGKNTSDSIFVRGTNYGNDDYFTISFLEKTGLGKTVVFTCRETCN